MANDVVQTEVDLKDVGYQGLIREDVMNQIWDISRIPLPFTDMISSDTAKQSYTEWTTDELQAPILTNKVADGDDMAQDDTALGARLGNHCQESVKQVNVSTRTRASDSIGRSDELSYQIMRRQQELRRDVEAMMLSQNVSIKDTGDGVTAGQAAGLSAWLSYLPIHTTGGSTPGFDDTTGLVAAVVDGTTPGALSETMVRDAVENVYMEGGDPSYLMSIPSVIRKFSEYLFTASARIATLQADQGKSSEKATALGSVNIFVTDFGTLTLVPNRLQQLVDTDTADAFVLDPTYVRQGFLSGYETEELAKTGLSDKRFMCVDWTLKVLNVKAHSKIADIDPSLAVIQ